MPHCLAGQIVKLQIGLIQKLDLGVLDSGSSAAIVIFRGGGRGLRRAFGERTSTIKMLLLEKSVV